MKPRMYGMLIASFGVIALMLTADETFAASRGISHGGSSHLTAHRSAAHLFRHRQRLQVPYIWSGDDDSFYGSGGEAVLDGTPPLPDGVLSSNASGIPWDWAHRYPPAVMPSGRPYVTTCPAETITVPDGHGGTGQVNIVRCY